MKTIFYWVILSIICGFTLTIASCSDDDDVTSLSAPGDIKYSDISSNSFKVTWTAVISPSTFKLEMVQPDLDKPNKPHMALVLLLE